MSEERKNRRQPGLALYSEYTGRFARQIDENPDQALDEYGFTFLYSLDESDTAAFLKKVDLAEDSWRFRFLEAVAQHRRGKLQEADTLYRKLISEEPTHKEIEYNLAALCLQKGDAAAANKHLAEFEKHLGHIPAGAYAEECRMRLEEFREEMKSF